MKFFYDFKWTSRLSVYLREQALCLKMGNDLESRLGLAAATLYFHATNGLGMGQHSIHSAPHRYRICLEQGVIEFSLRPLGGDLFVFHEIFLHQPYWIPMCWRDEGIETVVDLGANIGLTTMFFSQYFPNARYVCVEPNPANVPLLKRNIASLGERARVIEGAVSNCSGWATFQDTPWDWGGHLSNNGKSGSSVQCFSMGELMQKCALDRIDLLKVDIEGEESRVFASEKEWLKKVRFMIIELHGNYSLQKLELDLAPAGLLVIPPNSKYGNRMVCAWRPPG